MLEGLELWGFLVTLIVVIDLGIDVLDLQVCKQASKQATLHVPSS
jgi:hypothetical protein